MGNSMGGLADKIDMITNIIIVVTVILVITASVGFVLFFRYYKLKRREKLSDLSVDYSGLRRMDAQDYVKFEDIRERMIISEDGTLFTAAITCRGFDFFSAHVAERVNAQRGYRAFIHTISQPLTYRQYGTEVNLSDTNEMYEEALGKVEEKLFFLDQDFALTKKTMKDMETEYGEAVIDRADYQQIVDALDNLREQMENVKWRRIHLMDQLAYIGQLQNSGSEQVSHETYLVDWKYHPSDFPVDLTADEILERAEKELYSLTSTKIHALSRAGVKARRCSTKELVEMYRRHFNPLSAEYDRLDELENNAFFEDIITTEKKDALIKEQQEMMVIEAMNAAADAIENISAEGVVQE